MPSFRRPLRASGDAVNTSILDQELAPLEARMEQVRQKLEALKRELGAVEAELNAFSVDRERFDALREVCDALDRLGEMEADRLFWDEIPEAGRGKADIVLGRSEATPGIVPEMMVP